MAMVGREEKRKGKSGGSLGEDGDLDWDFGFALQCWGPNNRHNKQAQGQERAIYTTEKRSSARKPRKLEGEDEKETERIQV
ncbi:hypothetical protein TWF481_001582 [Arthrobotrys musiformis]|uniref:Uncharacterized protein n=1 Tax=Arthrobotrys musiformis TaxID=47236 RepID=A0AAV9VZS0_9PEZI